MAKVKKKIFIISETDDGCFYYRAEVFSRYSKKYQVLANVDFEKKIVNSPYDCLEKIFNSDVVVFLRPAKTEEYPILAFLRFLGRKVVFSGDDSFSTIDRKNPAHSIRKSSHVNEAFLRDSDFAVTTTDNLRKEYLDVNKRVLIVPNLIDLSDYIPSRSPKNKRLRVGLIGSVHTAENIDKFMNTLKQIHSNEQVTLVFFGSDDFKMVNEMKRTFLERVEFVNNVSMVDYPKKLASLDLDIALIPRKDNVFNRAKSNCKYLELSALGIATIAQGFKDGQSPYQKDIINGKNGFIALRDEDWLMHFNILKDDEIRKRITSEAYRLIIDKYDASSHIGLWDQAFDKILLAKPTVAKVSKEMLLSGLYDLYRDKRRDVTIKNYKSEVKYLNKELDRIRGRSYYKALSKTNDFLRSLKK